MRVLLVFALLAATAAMAQAPAPQGGAAPNTPVAGRGPVTPAPKDHIMIITAAQLDKILHPDPGTRPATRLFDGGNFSANELHRAPGDAEAALVHKFTSEVYVIQAGGGTLLTGGKLKDPVTGPPDQQAGKGIEGGTSQEVKAGDVVFIPAGVPHVFSGYSPDITYLNIRFQDSKYVGN
jgi:mannose-6-phosphate isomerase-like protein (cupin superfamily)